MKRRRKGNLSESEKDRRKRMHDAKKNRKRRLTAEQRAAFREGIRRKRGKSGEGGK